MQQHNATNLENSIALLNDMTTLLDQASHSLITNSKKIVISSKISHIWAHNSSWVDKCQLQNEDSEIIVTNYDLVYSSWIRFEIKFINSNEQDEWENELQSIIESIGTI